MFLRHDFSGISEYSTSREVTASCGVVVPVFAEPLFEDVHGSNLHQCSECTEHFSTRVGFFYTRPECAATGVQRLSISRATGVRGVSLFLPQRSRRTIITAAISSASFVRNRGALMRATKGSARSKRFLESVDLRIREIEGRNAAWLVLVEAQALVAAAEQAANHYQSQKPHPMGPR